MQYVPLHCHDEWSELDGVFNSESWLNKCRELGYPAYGQTNHGNMAGTLEYYLEAQKRDIKPILGTEGYFVPNYDKEQKPSHVILIAKNYEGFKNLLKIQKISWTEGFYYFPRISLDVLNKYGDNIIIMSACMNGILATHIINDNIVLAKDFADWLKRRFKDDFYIELMFLDIDNLKKVNYHLLNISEELKIPIVVTNDCHYLEAKHCKLQEKLIKISRPDFVFGSNQLWLKTVDELRTAWKKDYSNIIPEKIFNIGITNSIEIYDNLNVQLPIGKHKLPKFDYKNHRAYKNGFSKLDLFKYLVEKGFKKKIIPKYKNDKLEQYRKRKDMELNLIVQASGFIDYFLIVEDMVSWAKSNGVEVGAARGSVAGSLIAYLIGITVIDPIYFGGLLFERFLNPTRISGERAKEADALPDIDLDFSSSQRHLIKKYLINKYGEDKVCNIGAYGRLRLKNALKDFNRVDNKISYFEMNKLTSSFRDGVDDLAQACELSKEFKDWHNKNEKWVKRYVIPSIGQVRHISKHAAGVIITDNNLEEYIPIRTCADKENKDSRIIITQWEDVYCERAGLLKLDILGITQLDIFKYVKQLVRKRYNIYLDLNNIPLDDPKVYEKFSEGDTIGVFQFNSYLLTSYLKELQPDNFEDLIAANALVRPGPLENQFHTEYLKRKKGENKIEYIHPIVEPILKKTYGVVTYQEDLMAIFHALGKLSLAEADMARTAIKKKDPELIKPFRKGFVKGCIKNGMSKKEGDDFFCQLEEFSKYSFNRSHSASYSYIGYISQWLKVYYPLEFITALFEFANKDERAKLYGYIIKNNMDYCLPDIKLSRSKYYLKKDKIIFSLSAIDGIGNKSIPVILEHKPYKNFEDFYSRVNKRVANKRVVNNLILSGVFEGFGNVVDVLKQYYILRKEPLPQEYEKLNGRSLKMLKNRMLNIQVYTLKDIFKKQLKEIDLYDIICDYNKYEDVENESSIAVIGSVDRFYEFKSSRGKIAFINLKDGDKKYKIVCWADFWKRNQIKVVKDSVIVAMGVKRSSKIGEIQIELNNQREGKLCLINKKN